MTGFGAAAKSTPLGNFQVEIKTLNSRFLEFNMRIPGTISCFDLPLRQIIRSKIRRGKIDLSIRWDESGEALPRIRVNEEIMKGVYHQLKSLAKDLGMENSIDISSLTTVPNAFRVESPTINEKDLWHELSVLIKTAVDRCCQFRIREGKILKRQINSSLRMLKESHQEIMDLKDIMIKNYRERLRSRVADLVDKDGIPINQERIEAEVLFFVDKSDITEELIRIKAHMGGFKKYLSDSYEGQVGKALDFLSQELLREVNTIASKSRDTEVAQRVLIMKNEVEKIREQVQNIE